MSCSIDLARSWCRSQNVDDLIGGPGPDTFVADRQRICDRSTWVPSDRLVVELVAGADGAAAADLLTVESADLAGTLEVIGGPSSGLLDSTPVPFLSFGTAMATSPAFRGLDLGDGAYVRPTTVAGGYELRAGQLPDEIAIRFPSATDADEFFTFLSGKGNAFTAGTPVTIQLHDNELTGDLTVSGTPDSAILALTDAKLHFGGSQDALLTLEDDAATLTLTDVEPVGHAGRFADDDGPGRLVRRDVPPSHSTATIGPSPPSATASRSRLPATRSTTSTSSSRWSARAPTWRSSSPLRTARR